MFSKFSILKNLFFLIFDNLLSIYAGIYTTITHSTKISKARNVDNHILTKFFNLQKKKNKKNIIKSKLNEIVLI